MKIRINTEIIEALKPCAAQLVVWRENHKDFDGDILDFLELEKMISARDKIWVAVRVIPIFLMEVFAIDCAFSAYAAAVTDEDIDADEREDAESASSAASHTVADEDAVTSAYAYATYASNSAVRAVARTAYHAARSSGDLYSETVEVENQELENQVDALIMLIKGES